MTEPRFAFYEVVRATQDLEQIDFDLTAQEGVVSGISADDETPEPWYAVAFGDHDLVMLPEGMLVSTGRFVDESEVMSGESIRVSPEGELRPPPGE